MKLPLTKTSSIISEEDKDNKSSSSSSSSSEILETNKESQSMECSFVDGQQDGIKVSNREQVQQQFLNKSQQICEVLDGSQIQNLSNKDKNNNQNCSLHSLDNIKPDAGRQIQFPPNIGLSNLEYLKYAPPSIHLNQIPQSDSLPLLPLILPPSSNRILTGHHISMTERLTSVFPEDYRVEIPSATDINMETASCLWTDDHLRQHNILSLKTQMVPQNFPGMSLFQTEQQQYMLPCVGTLYESYYPFMVYSNPNNHGIEDPQQFQEEIISSNCRLQKIDVDEENNIENDGKQLIPRFLNKNELGWQTQPKIRIELECPETLSSFSSIPFISEKQNHIHNNHSQSAMFKETKQPACLASRNHPFQTSFNRPSFIHFQDNPNKDALDFKIEKEEIQSDQQPHQSLISQEYQSVYGEQILEESEKTEETAIRRDQNTNNSQFKIKYGLQIPNQSKYDLLKMINNNNPKKVNCHQIAKEQNDDESKVGIDGGSQCKLQLEEDFYRQSFSFPSCGKLQEKQPIEEESRDQEGNAVKALIMRLQKQQSNYLSNYYQCYPQNQDQFCQQEITGYHHYAQNCYPGQQQYPQYQLQLQVNQEKIRKQEVNGEPTVGSESKHQFNSFSRLQEEKTDNDGNDNNGNIQKEEEEEEEELDQNERLLSQQQQQQQSSYECDSDDEVEEKLQTKVVKKINKKNIISSKIPSVQSKKKTNSLKRKESDMTIEVRCRKASSTSVSCNSSTQMKNKFDTKNLVKNFLNQFLSFVSSEDEHNTIVSLLPEMNIDQQFQDDLKAFFKQKKYNRALLKEFIHVQNYRILFQYFLKNRAQDWITYGRMKDKPSHSRALSNFIYICENHDEIKSWRFRYNFV